MKQLTILHAANAVSGSNAWRELAASTNKELLLGRPNMAAIPDRRRAVNGVSQKLGLQIENHEIGVHKWSSVNRRVAPVLILNARLWCWVYNLANLLIWRQNRCTWALMEQEHSQVEVIHRQQLCSTCATHPHSCTNQHYCLLCVLQTEPILQRPMASF